MKSYIQNPRIRMFVPPISGFVFYGAWAMFINASHGSEHAIKAGLTQGGYSFCITLILALLVEGLFVRLANIRFKNLWVFLAAAILLSTTSVGLNWLAGTPEILWTVLPGLIVSLVYTVVYIFTLHALAASNKKL